MTDDGILYESDSAQGKYQVVDTIYSGRPTRLLYSGDRLAAQSGLAKDDKSELIFDYNERFMELIRGLLPRSIVLIGGGACTLPTAILEEFPDTRLDIVELNPELIDIAKRYFDFKPSKRTRVHYTDGLSYLQAARQSCAELIIIDAFINARIPQSLTTPEAARALRAHLKPGGVIAMNVIAAYHGARAAPLQQQISSFQTAFKTISIFPASSSLSLWLPQNFVLTAQNGGQNLIPYIRYMPLAVAEDIDL